MKVDPQYGRQLHQLSPKQQRPSTQNKQSVTMKTSIKDTPKAPTKVPVTVKKSPPEVVKAKVPQGKSENPEKIAPVVKKVDATIEKEEVTDTKNEEPKTEGHYELNTLMTRMVQSELQNIMITLWHELPDNPTSEADRLVVDTLRDNVSDELRNILGLNVTKRLLNIHNPLYVKIKFSSKPDSKSLKEFFSKYSIAAIKKLEQSDFIFAAQMKTINDFDRICTAKNLRCSNAKVTVIPCYKFSYCPPNLRTVFSDRNEEVNNPSQNEIQEEQQQISTKTTNQQVQKSTDAMTKEPQTSSKKQTDECVIKSATKTISTDNKASTLRQAEEANTKKNQDITEGKLVPNTTTPTKNENIQKDTVNVIKKDSTANKGKQKEEVLKEINSKTSSDNIVNVNIEKGSTNILKKSKSLQIELDGNDDDELDDQDILALMSEAIVLDEYVGSDED